MAEPNEEMRRDGPIGGPTNGPRRDCLQRLLVLR
jgi:hypothetical protein